jgi:hypothetical protein
MWNVREWGGRGAKEGSLWKANIHGILGDISE